MRPIMLAPFRSADEITKFMTTAIRCCLVSPSLIMKPVLMGPSSCVITGCIKSRRVKRQAAFPASHRACGRAFPACTERQRYDLILTEGHSLPIVESVAFTPFRIAVLSVSDIRTLSEDRSCVILVDTIVVAVPILSSRFLYQSYYVMFFPPLFFISPVL